MKSVDIAIVGASHENGGGPSIDRGAAYIFDVVTGQLLFELTADDDLVALGRQARVARHARDAQRAGLVAGNRERGAAHHQKD